MESSKSLANDPRTGGDCGGNDPRTGSNLLALAERCERATGPDRELDLAIARVRKVNPVPATAKFNTSLDGGECAWSRGMGMRVPAYTASLDAAMTLVPERANVQTQNFGSLRGPMVLVEPNERFASAATLPLALCAAALRARAAP